MCGHLYKLPDPGGQVWHRVTGKGRPWGLGHKSMARLGICPQEGLKEEKGLAQGPLEDPRGTRGGGWAGSW